MRRGVIVVNLSILPLHLSITLAFENCVDLAHALLAFFTAILYGVYEGQRSHVQLRLFKRKCNQHAVYAEVFAPATAYESGMRTCHISMATG